MKKIIFTLFFVIALMGCSEEKFNNIDNIEPAGEVEGKFSTICIEGHVYYILKPANTIAPKLTDNGKPVKCK